MMTRKTETTRMSDASLSVGVDTHAFGSTMEKREKQRKKGIHRTSSAQASAQHKLVSRRFGIIIVIINRKF